MAEDIKEQTEETSGGHARLTPIDFAKFNYVPGRYAPWHCSPENAYGPDELGEYADVIESLIKSVNKCDSAARIWEVLQSWEMRLFRRGYHFLNAGRAGWAMYGAGQSGGSAVMQTQNAMKLFAVNVFGARHKKIVALLSRDLPGVSVVPKKPGDAESDAASEEATKYKDVFIHEAGLKEQFRQACSYLYTDGRAGFLTYTVADQTRWGTESANMPSIVYGEEPEDGVTPETESQPEPMGAEQPVRKEITRVGGKLETRVPILADCEAEMGWKRFEWEEPVSRLKSMYPWVRSKITGGTGESMQQYDRMARINVRLAVQASSSSGEAYKADGTHTVTFIEPFMYEDIDKDEIRDIFYEEFPDGLEVWHAGGQLALVRNCRASKHIKIVHSTPGDGQNREAIGTYYLPLQKILNANISLLDRYFRAAVPRRYAAEGPIDTETINRQSNDPGKVTPVSMKSLPAGTRIADLTAIETVPTPNGAMVTFIQWLIDGGPEAMDGASAEIFGVADSKQDQGVYQTAKLRRDESRGVFNLPWSALSEAMCAITLQAIESAAENRASDIDATLPGERHLTVELGKLQGSVLVQAESTEIPQTLSEQEEQMAQLIEQSANVAIYQQIVNDPRNIQRIMQFPSLNGMASVIKDAVEQQQGEFEILLRTGPVPNPQILQMQQQIEQLTQQAQADPNAQGQLMQLTQQLQWTPPEVSTVPVAQDTSENHAVHAAITLGLMTSAFGRKLKYGDDNQKKVFENLHLHWQEHSQMAEKLKLPPEVEMKATVTIDPTKLPPGAQAKAFQALGLEVTEQEVTPTEQEHEITKEQQGVDPTTGVPTKTKISMVGKPLS
jgi:hypothetical protein